MAIWMILGVLYLGYLYLRQPQRVVDVGLVHLDAEPAVGSATAKQP